MQTTNTAHREQPQNDKESPHDDERQKSAILNRAAGLWNLRLNDGFAFFMHRSGRSIGRSWRRHLLTAVHCNPCLQRPQRILRSILRSRRIQGHQRIYDAKPVHRITPGSAGVVGAFSNTLNNLSRTQIGVLRLNQSRKARNQRSGRRRTRPYHVLIPRRGSNHIVARCRHANRNTLSRRALGSLTLTIHTAHRQYPRNSRRGTHLGNTAATVTGGCYDDHALLFGVGKSIVPALGPGRLIRANRKIDYLRAMIYRITHGGGNLLINTFLSIRDHVKGDRQNLGVRCHADNARRFTGLTGNLRNTGNIMTVAGNQGCNFGAVHGFYTQPLPTVRRAFTGGVITLQHVIYEIRVGAVDAGVNDGNRHARSRRLFPRIHNPVVGEPIFVLTNVVLT